MNSASGDPAGQFSLIVGGPFHVVLRRLGLTGANSRKGATLLPTESRPAEKSRPVQQTGV